MSPDGTLLAADLLATGIFALTGALVASRKEMDLFGFMWLAAATGVGGGTLRDITLGVPVFWVADPLPLAICLSVAVVMHFSASLILSRQRVILWLDAFGLAFAATAGTVKALELGTGGLAAIVMGLFSGTAGGILRDTLGQEPSIILRREIYMTAATLGGGAVVAGAWLGLPMTTAAAVGFSIALALRLVAIRFSLSLPAFRPRRGRP